MKNVKVVYIVSDIDKALSFEWLANRLKYKVNLTFVLLGSPNSQLSLFLKANSISFYDVKLDNNRILVWFRVLKILYQLKPAIVHTHLWQANLIGLSAAWMLRIPKRIFTRHHATVHYREHPSGRKWDKVCNALATDIVAISKNIEDILIKWDKASPEKVKLIHHGFDFDYFLNVSEDRIQSLRTKYNLGKHKGPVIGVIARYMQWKGIQYIIPAFEKMRRNYPTAHLVLANAHGEYESQIKQLLFNLPQESYTEIKFETDLASLYRLFDVYVHTPIDEHVEAFGQTYIEALLCRVPSIFTLSGVAREFINDNACVVNFQSTEEVYHAMLRLLSDNAMRMRFQENGFKSVQQFSLDTHILALLKLYTIQ